MIDYRLTEDNDMGRQYLVSIIEGNNTRVLSSFQPEEFHPDNLAKQEARARLMLAHTGLLPNGAYEGNPFIFGFSLESD